jgi:hypothetical protein
VKDFGAANDLGRANHLSYSPLRTTTLPHRPSEHKDTHFMDHSLDEELLNNQNSPNTINSKSQPAQASSPSLRKKIKVKELEVAPVLGPKNFYNDNFILRFASKPVLRKNGHNLEIKDSKVMSKEDFNDEIRHHRPNNPYWATLSNVQLAPVNKIGLGKLIRFCFSPIYIEKSELFTAEEK